jgi:predicted transcriptional regulator
MKVATGTVVDGKVVLNDPGIADGTQVFVLAREHEQDVQLTSEELAELEAGIAEADRGETIPGAELLARLRNRK